MVKQVRNIKKEQPLVLHETYICFIVDGFMLDGILIFKQMTPKKNRQQNIKTNTFLGEIKYTPTPTHPDTHARAHMHTQTHLVVHSVSNCKIITSILLNQKVLNTTQEDTVSRPTWRSRVSKARFTSSRLDSRYSGTEYVSWDGESAVSGYVGGRRNCCCWGVTRHPGVEGPGPVNCGAACESMNIHISIK